MTEKGCEMNTRTGEVTHSNDPRVREHPELWQRFDKGEVLEVKGVKFRVKRVSYRNLELHFHPEDNK